jgi:hypothetical protein
MPYQSPVDSVEFRLFVYLAMRTGTLMELQLGYVSTAANPMRREALVELLGQSRKANSEKQISGLLLYQGGHFFQVLEGAPDEIRELFERIAGDPRHTHVAVVFEQPIEQRHFADWSMGFQALEGSEWLEFPDIDQGSCDLRRVVENHGKARELLRMLRQRGIDPKKDLAAPA